jgi:hypothetical protein
MKKAWLAVSLVCAVCLPVIAHSQTPQYQDGKIIAVKKLPSHDSAGHTDTPMASEVDDYEISIQVGDTVYVCRYVAHSDQDLSWTHGKEGKVRIKGKTMYVKRATGRETQASILRRTKVSTP